MLNLFLDIIPMKKLQPKPIRMCIACRQRYPQPTLIRLKQEGKTVEASDGKGRSFYLCIECTKSEKKIRGLMKRLKQDDSYFTTLIEPLTLHVDVY